MLDAYKNGQDLYSVLAAKTFSLLARRMSEDLSFAMSQGKLNLADPAHGLSPFKHHLWDDGFVFIANNDFQYKELRPEDCYDGTLYRKMAKTLLLGMLYGMSSKGLSVRLKISEEDAAGIISDFYTAFPSIKAAMDLLYKFAVRTGFVETEWGRKRRLPDIWNENKWIRAKAGRQLFNSKIQGGAADMLKIAMLLVYYDPRLAELLFELLLTVHDELIGQVPPENAYEASIILAEDMMACAELLVPLKVDVEIYYDGSWNGPSYQAKFKGGQWKLFDGADQKDPDLILSEYARSKQVCS